MQAKYKLFCEDLLINKHHQEVNSYCLPDCYCSHYTYKHIVILKNFGFPLTGKKLLVKKSYR